MFDIEGFRNDLAYKDFREISSVQIESGGLFELVKSYLVHYAYVETLQALEEENTIDDSN